MRFLGLFVLFLALGCGTVYGNSPEFIKQIHAIRLQDPIRLDGFLSEPVYQHPGVTAFYQRDPNQGEPVSELTEVWVAYDDGALYIGARLKDSQPDSIIARLVRRDVEIGSDEFLVGIDSYYDHRTGYYFGVSASGTVRDGILYNDDWSDNSWDGVWEGKAQRMINGWTVEMRIPYSQLRFEKKDVYVWGFDCERIIGRKKEQSFLVYTPRNESGFVSRFPELIGIDHIDPPSRLEAVPYLTTRAEFTQHAPNDPFNSGSRYRPGVGADLKIGLGSNLTLDATINPDFGQVEVDPAVVNLSDVESYFQEKRPFFVEGMNVFSFGYGGATNFWSFNWSNPELFYSRRIGRAPQGSLPGPGDFTDIPIGTHILGAGKLTGRLGESWKLGTIHAITQREYAEIDTSGTHWRSELEPMTYYGIGRLQRDFNDGKQGLGFIATATSRNFSDDRLRDEINSASIVTGIDGWTFLDSEKEFVITGWSAGSYVRGNSERMVSLQRSSAHYFQRPDAQSYSVDSTRTSLSGYAGRILLNKQKGRVMINSAIGWISPGFESSDMGFVWRTDVINGHLGIGYKWTTPTDYYRNITVIQALFGSKNFDGNTIWAGWWGMTDIVLPNYHEFVVRFAYNPETVNNRRTRGGPLTLTPPGREYGFEYYSDSRNAWVASLMYGFYESDIDISRNIDANLELRPSSSVTISAGPSFATETNTTMWIGNFSDPLAGSTFQNRYVFATLEYTSVGANLKMNWTLSPTLSLQAYFQPLFTSGRYIDFKELTRPRSLDLRNYGTAGSTLERNTDANGTEYVVLDPDGNGPADPITIKNPDFNSVELRGNLVLRWEYLPGSTFYLVWTQSRSEWEQYGDFTLRHSFDRLVGAKANNILMLKLTYWLGK